MLRRRLAALTVALGLVLVIAPPAAAAGPTGFASATCTTLTWGASNPTSDPIEVRLELDGVDTNVVPTMVVQPGHTSSRFNAYAGSHHVGLRVDGELIFGEYLAGPFCGLVVQVRGQCHALRWGADNAWDRTTLRLYVDGRYVRSLLSRLGSHTRVLTPFRGRHRVTVTTWGTVVFDGIVRSHC